SESKKKGKGKGNTLGSKKTQNSATQKQRASRSDEEISKLPKEEQDKASLKIENGDSVKGKRWTSAEKKNAIDHITSAEIAEVILKGSQSKDQVRSWWLRTFKKYQEIKLQMKHTGGGDGDQADQSESDDQGDAGQGRKRKRAPPKDDFKDSYVYKQLDKVSTALSSAVADPSVTLTDPEDQGQSDEQDEGRPRIKKRRGTDEEDALVNQVLKDVVERSQERVEIERRKVRLMEEEAERQREKDRIVEESKKVETELRRLDTREEQIIKHQTALIQAMNSNDEDIKMSAKERYKSLTKELSLIHERRDAISK
ncbi:4274_t:CDS:2, partial [Acaulospora colombiana]